MSQSDQVLLFVCLRRVLLLSVAISAVAGQKITEVGGGIDDDVSHRKVISSVTEVADEVHAITNEGIGANYDGSDGKVTTRHVPVCISLKHSLPEIIRLCSWLEVSF